MLLAQPDLQAQPEKPAPLVLRVRKARKVTSGQQVLKVYRVEPARLAQQGQQAQPEIPEVLATPDQQVLPVLPGQTQLLSDQLAQQVRKVCKAFKAYKAM